MKIAVLGAGQVGGAIGRAWAAKGHEVIYGVPDPHAAKYAALPTARTPGEATAGADAVLLAVPWPVTEPALAGAGDLTGKLLIDATNPLVWSKETGLALSQGFTDSGGEQVQRWAPGARVVKSLNQLGFEILGNAGRFATPPVMYLAGDDADAKAVTAGLLVDLGFEAIDAGALSVSRLLEPLAMLWIHQAINLNRGRDFALGMLRG